MKNLTKTIEHDLIILTNALKKCKSTHHYENLFGTYLALQDIIDSLELQINYPKELEYEITKKNINNLEKKEAKKIIEYHQEYLEYNKKIANMYKILSDKYYHYIPTLIYNNKVDVSTSLEIIKDFFQIYDKNISLFVNNYIENGNLFYGNIYSDITGLTYEGTPEISPYTNQVLLKIFL